MAAASVPTQASRHFKETVAAHLLAFANRRHISTDALRAACNDLINLYAEFGLPLCWGSGESAAADGSLLETYEENLFAAHHVRYGRSGGIAYRHVADTYIALFTSFHPLRRTRSDLYSRWLTQEHLRGSTHATPCRYPWPIDHGLWPGLSAGHRTDAAHTQLAIAEIVSNRHPRSSAYTRSLYSGTIDWALIEAHWEDYLRVVWWSTDFLCPPI